MFVVAGTVVHRHQCSTNLADEPAVEMLLQRVFHPRSPRREGERKEQLASYNVEREYDCAGAEIWSRAGIDHEASQFRRR